MRASTLRCKLNLKIIRGRVAYWYQELDANKFGVVLEIRFPVGIAKKKKYIYTKNDAKVRKLFLICKKTFLTTNRRK